MKKIVWPFAALVIGSAAQGAEPVHPPFTVTPDENRSETCLPGGYFRGLTKPLMVDVDARIWGPGIATPPPGGMFLAKIPGSKTPPQKNRSAISRPSGQR